MAAQDTEVGMIVLVVEPESAIRTGISALLSASGFDIVEAGGTDGIWAMLETLPDVGVLVTDLDAPGGASSLELVRKVHERWPTLGVVVTSSHIRHLSPSDVPGDGCFLPHPLPIDTLLHEVKVAAHQITA